MKASKNSDAGYIAYQTQHFPRIKSGN